MEVSRGTAYGIGISQCAVTLGIVLFSPLVQVEVFVAHEAVNASALSHLTPPSITVTTIGMSMPVLLASVLACVFSTVTCNLSEQGLSGMDFQQDTIEQAAMWDLLFWAFCLLLHLDIVLMITNPADLYGCVAATSFLVYFLHRSCAPRGQNVSLTQENLNLVGYCLGVLQVVSQIPEADSNAVTVVVILVVVDYFLGIGHTWDRQATIETVINCRLFYICCGMLVLDALYCIQGTAVKTTMTVP